MLVVKIEVWPGGTADRSFEISRVGLANTTPANPFANYDLTALMERDKGEFVVRSEINGHDRSCGWVPLVRRSMTALFLGEHGVQGIPYDDPVAELLRKG